MIATCRNALPLLLPALVLAGALAGVPAEPVPDELKTHYSELRKDFFIAMALAPAEDGIRREHRRYLNALTRFIRRLDDSHPDYTAAALYFRGRVLLRVKLREAARRDFDRCLEALGTADMPVESYPPGLPVPASIRFFRAFTFQDEGPERLLTELESIPAEGAAPRYHEVGNLLARWAEALSEANRIDEAIRAYEVIKKFGLWEEEYEDPQKQIDLLKLRRDGGAAF